MLEDIYKPQIIKARSPRKTGTPFRHHFGLSIESTQGNSLDPHCSYLGGMHHMAHHNVGTFGVQHTNHPHTNNFSNDEMMEVSSGIPHA